ncbi:oxoglutarate iron-dependent dioxygenase [Raphidocelis subcapitata]|uniref:Oxoglutarate iron-dependent dioxygenase n=1 Tax=Raphidocelis subcapitata TaxID=307507 RepID=A0A2V0NRD4_9CHLO|nr:oxoglutarate iron-dependent dioxygenase [Raphidocelis subcapitata]|eukprot:GBF89879.1 oxoglutarate iron-dependent dioxygenase [Raphidocelis subcapitata]
MRSLGGGGGPLGAAAGATGGRRRRGPPPPAAAAKPPPATMLWRAAAERTALASAASEARRPRPTRPAPAAAGRQADGDGAEDAGEAEGGESEAEFEGPLPELSEARHIIVQPGFSDAASDLRAVFDERFGDPRKPLREHFLWHYWYVENQYTLHRTQAAAYFPKALYKRLESDLIAYGERVLGCRAITPVWMSYYVDGCAQELHCDSFHGPFAFVLSLTHWEERAFTGGETMILKPATLDFWSGFQPGRGLELGDLVELVPPRFNQLTLFDPRLPHGVRPVHGTRDPMKSRLVLHGWFTEPSPFIEGGLEPEAAVEALNEALDAIFEEFEALPAVLGTLTVRIDVRGADGGVDGVAFLADTLVVRPGQVITDDEGEPLPDSAARAAVQHAVRDGLAAARFPACAGGDTRVTYPFVFE